MKKLTFINSILTLLIIGVAFGWMITEISRGEITEYNKRLVISALDIDIKLYELIDDTYELVTAPDLDLSNLAPGEKKFYKFTIKNNNSTVSTSKIVFSNITGDIVDLQDKIYIGSTSPDVRENNLSEVIETSGSENIIRFYESLEVQSNEEVSIYWYIGMDELASNEVADKVLDIDSINFVKP